MLRVVLLLKLNLGYHNVSNTHNMLICFNMLNRELPLRGSSKLYAWEALFSVVKKFRRK